MTENFTKLTIPSLLKNSFDKYIDRPALSLTNGGSYTYSDVREKILQTANILKSYGIAKGDKVAILGENHPNWGIAFFAVTYTGAVAVPIMHEFTTIEIEYILEHSEAKALFVSSKMNSKLADTYTGSLNIKISLEDFEISTLNPGIETAIFNPSDVEEEDTASIIYTSGTTGHSKGVMLSHKNLVSDAIAADEVVGVRPDDKFLSILPLSHTTECTLGLIIPIMKGACVYYLEKPPAAAALIPALLKIKPTVMLSVPLIIEKLYRSKIIAQIQSNKLLNAAYKVPVIRKTINKKAGNKLLETFGGNLRLFCIGGASLAEDVEKFLIEAQFPYTVGYGLTETSPLVTGSHPTDFKFRSTGKILQCLNVKIENPDPLTGIGEILIKGPNVMKGYFKNPDKTNEAFNKDGWLRTGDLGYIDNESYLFIKGRIKNVIIGANGKNIYPEELESLINECEHVVESLVLKKDNKLIARVHLDYDKLNGIYPNLKSIESGIRREIQSIFENILAYVNGRVASFSKLSGIDEQTVPFEKTPTRKIKRYLYH